MPPPARPSCTGKSLCCHRIGAGVEIQHRIQALAVGDDGLVSNTLTRRSRGHIHFLSLSLLSLSGTRSTAFSFFFFSFSLTHRLCSRGSRPGSWTRRTCTSRVRWTTATSAASSRTASRAGTILDRRRTEPSNARGVGFSPPSDAISQFKVQTNSYDAQVDAPRARASSIVS